MNKQKARDTIKRAVEMLDNFEKYSTQDFNMVDIRLKKYGTSLERVKNVWQKERKATTENK